MKLLKFVLIGVFMLALAACGRDTNNPDNRAYANEAEQLRVAEPTPEPPPAPIPIPAVIPEPTPKPTPPPAPVNPICFYRAAEYIATMEAWFDADDGALWGVNLRAPFAFACGVTRYAVANMPDNRGIFERHESGLYVGILPQGIVIGTTATHVDDRMWGMMTWSFVEDFSDGTDYVARIMAHEVFHAWQPELFEGPETWFSRAAFAYMDTFDARVSVRLEINALKHALYSIGNERLAAINDALSIRAERRRRNFGAGANENVFEIAEGTATYTDIRLARSDVAGILEVIEIYTRQFDYGRVRHLFGYITGALYGFLLDEFNSDWKIGLTWGCDLGALLKEAAGIMELTPFAELDLELYGYTEIAAIEAEWAINYARLVQEAIEAFTGRTLRLDRRVGVIGDDRDVNILHITELGMSATVIYGSFTFTFPGGKFTITDGFLLMGRLGGSEFPAAGIEIDGNRITGQNWVLVLNDGYEVRFVETPVRDGYIVARQ